MLWLGLLVVIASLWAFTVFIGLAIGLSPREALQGSTVAIAGLTIVAGGLFLGAGLVVAGVA